MTIYKVYTTQNLADTMRDPDNIVTTELGYKQILNDALKIAKKYIKNNFFHKDTELRNTGGQNYQATDFCSYGETIYIDEIEVE